MDNLLIVTPNDRFYAAIESRLSDCYAIRRSWAVDQIQPLVDQGQVSVLLLDCPADDAPFCEFLRQNELTHPFLECVAVIEPESFCRLALSKSHALFTLLRPVELEDVARALRETKSRLARVAAFPPANDPVFVRQQEQRFWLTLIHSGAPEGGPVSDAPPPINFSFQLDQPILPLLVCFRGWRGAGIPTGA